MHPRLKAVTLLLLALALAPLGCGQAVSTPSVVTVDATDIAADAATLNGDLTGLGTASEVEVSFQWWSGSSKYLTESPRQSLADTGQFSFELTGLDPDTTYHFRARAAGDGTDYGGALSFRTAPLP
jgi:hypothetical protein